MCFVTTYVSLVFVFFKQKTAYEMRISDWSSDVCSSDLSTAHARLLRGSVEGTVPLAPKKGTSTCRTSSSSPAMSAPRLGAAQILHGDHPLAGRRVEHRRQQAVRQGLGRHDGADGAAGRSEDRSVGKEGVRQVRSRGA